MEIDIEMTQILETAKILKLSYFKVKDITYISNKRNM